MPIVFRAMSLVIDSNDTCSLECAVSARRDQALGFPHSPMCFFTSLLFEKEKWVLCASLLLKMNLGISWILGFFSTFQLIRAPMSPKSFVAGFLMCCSLHQFSFCMG